MTPVEGNTRLQQLLDHYGHPPHSKNALTHGQFDEFANAVRGHPVTISPGGSSANVLVTLGKLLKHQVKTTFIGITGDDMYSNMVRGALADAGIELEPKHLPQGTPR